MIKTAQFICVVLILVSCSKNDSNTRQTTDYKLSPNLDTLRFYYDDGNLKALVPLDEGKKSGYVKEFYEDGTLKENVHYVSDKLFGHAYYYHSNGQMSTYSSFDFTENPRYVRKYDKNGNIEYDEGSVLGQLMILGNDSLKLLFSYAKPPKTYIEVRSLIYSDARMDTSDVQINKQSGKLIFDSGFKLDFSLLEETKRTHRDK